MLFLVLLLGVNAAAPFFAGGDQAIADEYIVVFKEEATPMNIEAYHNKMASFNDDHAVRYRYAFPTGTFAGYSAVMSKVVLSSVLSDDLVKYVEANQMGNIVETCETQEGLPSGLWGLARINRRETQGPSEYSYDRHAGQHVDVYVLDTGIQCTHDDFAKHEDSKENPRCEHGFDATGEGFDDLHGHGTHVAGTVGGLTFGLAKESNLVNVKVCNRFGSCPQDGQIAGINYVATETAARRGSKKSVANMSIGSALSQAVHAAITAATDAGNLMVVASGNSNTNACNTSPAAAADALTVNAIASGDGRSSFSNFGTCTNIFAPGSAILSAWIGTDSASREASGTSMASPHVAGGAAVLFSRHGATDDPRALRAELVAEATANAVTNPGAGSPNLLLYTNCQE